MNRQKGTGPHSIRLMEAFYLSETASMPFLAKLGSAFLDRRLAISESLVL
jgi:hypothetical protein